MQKTGLIRIAVLACLLSTSTATVHAQSDKDPFAAEALSKRMEDGPVEASLHPAIRSQELRGPRWSLPGSRFELAQSSPEENKTRLTGEFSIGKVRDVKVRLDISESANGKDDGRTATYRVDCDGNEQFGEGESFPAIVSLSRGKTYISVDVTLKLSVPAAEAESQSSQRTYPVHFWYVLDPDAKDADPIMRWSPRGWQEGTIELAGKKCVVAVKERDHDGELSKADHWGITIDGERGLRDIDGQIGEYAWVGEIPYRIVSFDPDGSNVVFEAFDLGMTRAEDEERRDPYSADKKAARAKQPVLFLHDYQEALEVAEENGQLVLVDFETTWCGPCKMMDRYVYTAKSVVDAGKNVVWLKLDGDEEKELVEQFAIEAYPTLLLIDSSGKVLGRRRGYQSCQDLAAFLKAANKINAERQK